MSEEFDAIVIGAGEAGAVLASRAVEAGQRVANLHVSCLRVARPPFRIALKTASA